MKSVSKKTSEVINTGFPIVAIGGAEGSIPALEEMLQHLPAKTGMIYLFFYAGNDTDLDSVLKLSPSIPIITAKLGEPVKQDHLYMISMRQPLVLEGSVFVRLPEKADDVFADLPFNRFFSFLSDQYKEWVIGILLSGNHADGAFGLKSVKLGGGVTLGQNETAEFGTLPRNAIAEDVVDLVLSPNEIAAELTKISKQKDIYFNAIQELDANSINNSDEDLAAILHLVNRSVGVDFSQYKMNTIKRRIIRRMMLFKLDTLKSYAQYIKQNPNEVPKLYQDLLINVTNFFRDPEGFEYVKSTLLPKIIQIKSSNDPIRVWIPACSTGQEAYSIAILIVEALGNKAASMPVQIYATDLSEVAINKARLGIYTKDDLQNVSPQRMERFFNKIDGHYRVVKSVRDMCVFATHNIAKDPPFSRLDIISCCNLLIYIEAHLQKKIISTFHYSLQNNGYLILGKSETVGASAYLFSQVEKKFKIYSKKKDTSAKAFFEMNYRLPEPERVLGAGRRNTLPKAKADEVELDQIVDQMLLKNYTPACVVVNEDLDILQFRGSTGLYLEPSPGKASLNLMKMARQSLGFELRNIVHKAKKTGERVKKEALEIQINNKTQRISVEAIPIHAEGLMEDDYFMVVFEQSPLILSDQDANTTKDKRAKQLEKEIMALRDDMRSIIESQEAVNEELQSANEEIVSSNEELQSINEELETSKEEIESSNEELITINQELQMRNEQLAEVQEYSEAVLDIIRESILILDKDLRVKTANSAFYKTFKVFEEETEGRYVYDLGNGQWDIPSLRKLLHEVIPANNQFFGFEVNHRFPGVGEKIMILNARKMIQRAHGQQVILLAIEDITEHRQSQKVITEQEAWMRHMADHVPAMLWICAPNKQIRFCNQTWLDYRGLSMDEARHADWLEGIHPDDHRLGVQKFEKAFAACGPFSMQYRLQGKEGLYKWVITQAKPYFTPKGDFDGFIGSCIEVPEQDQGKLG
ncbi:MAG TPA: CheR family methyltransferase [Flavisolibacter sp.]|nr:CheR family methyltransferase [Flavisolibacter sp.]